MAVQPAGGNIQMSSLHHCLQRWEDLLVRKIACGAEETNASEWKLVMNFILFKQLQILAFPDVRRIQNALRTGVCRHSRLRRVS